MRRSGDGEAARLVEGGVGVLQQSGMLVLTSTRDPAFTATDQRVHKVMLLLAGDRHQVSLQTEVDL